MEIISRKEAKALGLKHYFTGRPCKYGHTAVKYVSSKECIECRGARNRTQYWADQAGNLEKNRTYLQANKERVRERKRRQHEANAEKYRKATLVWQKANPEKTLAHSRNRRARQKGAAGSHTAADIIAIYRLQNGRCACGCNELLNQKYDIDHIIPLSLGGSNDRRNLQLLRPGCNKRKSAKDPIRWAQENGRLL